MTVLDSSQPIPDEILEGMKSKLQGNIESANKITDTRARAEALADANLANATWEGVLEEAYKQCEANGKTKDQLSLDDILSVVDRNSDSPANTASMDLVMKNLSEVFAEKSYEVDCKTIASGNYLNECKELPHLEEATHISFPQIDLSGISNIIKSFTSIFSK